MFVFTLVLSVTVFTANARTGPLTGEAMIYNDNVTKYGPRTRAPAWDGKNKKYTYDIPTPVELDYYPVKLLAMKQAEQEIVIGAVISFAWNDTTRFNWDYRSTKVLNINVPQEKLWYPTIGHMRSVDANYKLGSDEEEMVMAYYSGFMVWLSGNSYTSPCLFDVTYFPFDVQVCNQTFAPWPDASKVNLTSNGLLNRNFSQRMQYYEPNSEWEISDVTSHILDTTLSVGARRNELIVTLQLTRKPMYYVYTILIPSFLLAFLVLMVFMLPADAGEKISFGITVLLTFSVFQLQVNNSLPHSSDSYPVIGILILFLEVMSAISILVSVVVLNIHHFGGVVGTRMGNGLRKFIFGFLAYMVCSCGLVRKPRKNKAPSKKGKLKIGDPESDIDGKVKQTSNGPSPLDEILAKLDKFDKKMEEDELAETIATEWKLAALIVDRVLMLICFIVIVIVLLVMFIPMVHHYKTSRRGV